ncbi:hypothetical protein ABLT93_07685 [Acinetobacter soli]|uniref:hypothetical protein n=1 Tax=Acinetobacter soli TaxID=487316 RepID=UPI00125F2748|nr:hypothetical protein [Acinetobacter soli]
MFISKGTIIGAIIGFIFIQIGIGLYHGATIRWDRVEILAKYAILFCLIWLLYKLIKARRKQEQEKIFRSRFRKSGKTFKRSPSGATRRDEIFRNGRENSNISLKDRIRSEFNEFLILEKNGQILICETDVRGEFNELIFIRLNLSLAKRIENKGQFIVATYPYVPSGAEMRKDFDPILRKYR